MTRYKWCLWLALAVLVISICQTAAAGQRRRGAAAPPQDEGPMATMSVEELRAYQSYFFAQGMRDPMTMRLPTAAEIGETQGGRKHAPTVDEQRQFLAEHLEKVTQALREQKYQEAIEVSDAALKEVEQWPPIKPEHGDLLRMVDEIRNFNRMALTLKRHEDIKKEFLALSLKVDGVVWSPIDAKAVINGLTYSAGEVLTQERKQGDLRIEMIEEHGVVFQFQGIRFRLPVEMYAPINFTGDL